MKIMYTHVNEFHYILSENCRFLAVKFSIYLNKHAFVIFSGILLLMNTRRCICYRAFLFGLRVYLFVRFVFNKF